MSPSYRNSCVSPLSYYIKHRAIILLCYFGPHLTSFNSIWLYDCPALCIIPSWNPSPSSLHLPSPPLICEESQKMWGVWRHGLKSTCGGCPHALNLWLSSINILATAFLKPPLFWVMSLYQITELKPKDLV